MVNMRSSVMLPSWKPTPEIDGDIIANMATRIGQRRRAHLYIEEWIAHRGLTIPKLASRLGVDRSTVNKWLATPSRLDPGKMEALALALDIEPEELYRPPSQPSLDAIVKDYPDDLRQKAAEIVRLLGKTG